MDFIRSLFEQSHENDENDVMSKVKAAEKASNDRDNTKGFALENEDGSIVKVFVQADQADDFERVLSRTLYDDEEGMKKEIPEVLYELRKSFDIVDVDWGQGTIPEDEEVEQEVQDDGGIDADLATDEELDLEGGEGEDLEMDAEENLDDSLADFEGEDESDAYSALDKVIDMMKADSEAKTAEAEARKAQAEADLARESLRAAEYRAAQEEEILDMEEYNKRKQEEKKTDDTREKLIKYRHELKNNNNLGESMKYRYATPEEEEVMDMEDWEERERKKKEHENTQARLNKYRHKNKQTKAEDEEHASSVDYKQKKDDGSQRGMSMAKAKGDSFEQNDHTKGSVVDQQVKRDQVKDTTKGDSGMSIEKAKGKLRAKRETLAKMRYYGEQVEDGDLKNLTFAKFAEIEAKKDQ